MAAHYSSSMKFLHWAIALIVMPMVLGSFFLEDLTKNIKPTAVMLHRSFGLTVLVLMIMRLIALHTSQRPALPSTMPHWERLLSRVVQYALYISLIAMPLVGWSMSMAAGHAPVYFGLFSVPFPGIPVNEALSNQLFSIHRAVAFTIIGLMSLHILGALKHFLSDRDKVMDSMLPFIKD